MEAVGSPNRLGIALAPLIAGWLAQMPLAPILHPIAHRSQHLRQILQIDRQHLLAVRKGSALGKRIHHPVAGRIETGEERGPAGRTHGSVAEGPAKLNPVIGQRLATGHCVIGGPILRPVLGRTFLIRDDKQEVGLGRQGIGNCHSGGGCGGCLDAHRCAQSRGSGQQRAQPKKLPSIQTRRGAFQTIHAHNASPLGCSAPRHSTAGMTA